MIVSLAAYFSDECYISLAVLRMFRKIGVAIKWASMARQNFHVLCTTFGSPVHIIIMLVRISYSQILIRKQI